MNSGKAGHILTDTALPLDIIREWQKFAVFYQKTCGDDLLDIDDDTRATDELAAQLAGRTTVELLEMPIPDRNKLLRELRALLGVKQRQIERITGINRNMIQRA